MNAFRFTNVPFQLPHFCLLRRFCKTSLFREMSALSRPCLKKQGRRGGAFPWGGFPLPEGRTFPTTFPSLGKWLPSRGERENKRSLQINRRTQSVQLKPSPVRGAHNKKLSPIKWRVMPSHKIFPPPLGARTNPNKTWEPAFRRVPEKSELSKDPQPGKPGCRPAPFCARRDLLRDACAAPPRDRSPRGRSRSDGCSPRRLSWWKHPPPTESPSG